MSVVQESGYFHTGINFRIRETRAEDLSVWYSWFNDPEITRLMIHGLYPNTLEAQDAFRSKYIDSCKKVMFSIVAPDTSELIGTCSINLAEPSSARRCEISLVIGAPEFRKGSIYLGVTAWQLDHAFYQLNMNSVYAATHECNIVVQHTLERIGFNRAGVMRQVSYKNGHYYNSIWYDLLHSEWEQRHPPSGLQSRVKHNQQR